MKRIKKAENLTKLLVLFILAIVVPISGRALEDTRQESMSSRNNIPTYTEFHSRYKPNNELMYQNNKGVKIAQQMDAKTLASFCNEYVKNSYEKVNRTTFTTIILGVSRKLAGQVIDNMNSEYQASGINLLEDLMALDIIYYISELTYKKNANKFNALKHFKGLVDKQTINIKHKQKNSSFKSSISKDVLPTYAEFRALYSPHNEYLEPNSKRVKFFTALTVEIQAEAFNSFMDNANDEKSIRTFRDVILTIPRKLAGNVIDHMRSEYQAKAINFLVDRMALDIIYYVSESTYNANAQKFNALISFSKGIYLKR